MRDGLNVRSARTVAVLHKARSKLSQQSLAPNTGPSRRIVGEAVGAELERADFDSIDNRDWSVNRPTRHHPKNREQKPRWANKHSAQQLGVAGPELNFPHKARQGKANPHQKVIQDASVNPFPLSRCAFQISNVRG